RAPRLAQVRIVRLPQRRKDAKEDRREGILECAAVAALCIPFGALTKKDKAGLQPRTPNLLCGLAAWRQALWRPKVEKRKILIQLDSDPQPSVFDRVVAIDAGA